MLNKIKNQWEKRPEDDRYVENEIYAQTMKEEIEQ